VIEFFKMRFQLPSWWNWKVTYALLQLILLSALYYSLRPFPADSPATTASVVWGIVTLVLCLIFMLGAAQTPTQFLVFFGTGAFGAGMGYLVGAWLTPSGDSNPLDQARNIVAGVLTGVVGTKLLTLWDDLVDRPTGGGQPPIMTAPYFVPVVLWLVGFTVSLAAFYTVRTGESGDVRVTYSPKSAVLQLGGKHIGVLPDTTVTFAGAANSPEDVTVKLDFRLEGPCGTPVQAANVKPYDKVEFDKKMVKAFNTETGELHTPEATVLQEWINSCPGSQNWLLTATSNQDRSKFSRYNLKFCRTVADCPATPPASPVTSATGTAGTSSGTGTGGGPHPPTSQPSAEPGAPPTKGKEEIKKDAETKPGK
jgi:hypothetical protein